MRAEMIKQCFSLNHIIALYIMFTILAWGQWLFTNHGYGFESVGLPPSLILVTGGAIFGIKGFSVYNKLQKETKKRKQ